MGAVISRWRKKPTTVEVLEQIDKDIQAIEKTKRSNLDTQKQVIGALVIYSVVLYVIASLLFYFYYLPDDWVDRLLYSSPLLAFPFLVFFIKRFLHWYFVKRISKNESALTQLRDKKKTILEEVMEKETYKKAKEILEKFDPESQKKLEIPPDATPAPSKSPDGQDLRQRTVGRGTPQRGPAPTPGGFGGTPHLPRQPFNTGRGRPPMTGNGQFMQMTPGLLQPPGPPMPRSILPRERGMSDRMIEFLVGDGPQNRYALICSQCFSHNGMALKEEFEYLNFRCCYCYTLNKARKERPFAPRLETPPMPRKEMNQEVAEITDDDYDDDMEEDMIVDKSTTGNAEPQDTADICVSEKQKEDKKTD